MTETLHGLQAIAVYMDDIVVYGGDMEEHDPSDGPGESRVRWTAKKSVC